jgi:hypothetical protein
MNNFSVVKKALFQFSEIPVFIHKSKMQANPPQ